MEFNLIIVDDDKYFLNNMIDYLNMVYEDSVNIKEFSNIDSFIDYFSDNKEDIDLIFFDYNLQDNANGLELAEIIRNSDFTKKIVFITGEGGIFLKTKIKWSGIDNYTYIEKNNDLETSLEKIIDIEMLKKEEEELDKKNNFD